MAQATHTRVASRQDHRTKTREFFKHLTELRRGRVKVSVDRVRAPAKLEGLCYGPFRTGQSPESGGFPKEKELEADLTFLSGVARAVRTYSTQGSVGRIPELCDRCDIDCYPGAWLGADPIANRRELDGLIEIAEQGLTCVKGLVVGNECLLRGDVEADSLVQYIRDIKKETGLPVTTAEVWHVWDRHPELAAEADFLLVHVHPYWEGYEVTEAADRVAQVCRYLGSRFPDKRVVLGEFGWPSAGPANGRAVAGEAELGRFSHDVLSKVEAEGIPYFYFEAFDEPWKKERGVGPHWGVFNSDGKPKECFAPLLPENAREGMDR